MKASSEPTQSTTPPRERQPLTNAARQRFVEFVRAGNWPAVLAGLDAYRFAEDDDRVALRRIVARYVEARQDGAWTKWDTNIGKVMWSLGLQPGEAQPCACTEALAGFAFARPHKLVARENGVANLIQAYDRKTRLTKLDPKTGNRVEHQYAVELSTVGIREALLTALASVVQEQSAPLFAGLLVRAPALEGDELAPPRRRERLSTLGLRAGGFAPLMLRLQREPKSLLELYRTHAALSRGGHEVDAVELLFGLLARERGDAWLKTQLRARDGAACSACPQAMTPKTGSVLERCDGTRTRGAKRAADYELICGECAHDRRRQQMLSGLVRANGVPAGPATAAAAAS